MEHAGHRRLERWSQLRSVAEQCGGDDLCEFDEPASLFWLYGTTMVEACVGDDCEILLHAWLVIGPTKKPQWAHLVSRWEGGLPFGELLIDAEGDVLLAHCILPSTPTAVMGAQVVEFCRQADRLDDLICQQLGGLRGIDQFHRDVITAIANEVPGKNGCSQKNGVTQPEHSDRV